MSVAALALLVWAVVEAAPVSGTPAEILASPEPSSPAGRADSAPPEGMHYVGLGHVLAAVPTSWGLNQTSCFAPTRDTYVIDKPTDGLCGTVRAPGIEMVQVYAGERRITDRADAIVTIDGVRAERAHTTCTTPGQDTLHPELAPPGPAVCAGSLYFPEQRIGVYADSSTSAIEADRILARVRVLPHLAGIPESETLALLEGDRSGEMFQRELRELGLRARVIESDPGDRLAGELLSVLPPSGTVLRAGDEVTVFVNALRAPGRP